MEDLNQIPASTTPYTGDTRPYQDWQVLQSVYNAAVSNYNALSVVVEKQTGNGLRLSKLLRLYARSLERGRGCAVEPCRRRRKLPYRPLPSAAGLRQRRLRSQSTASSQPRSTTFPSARVRSFSPAAVRFVRGLVSNWQVGGVFIWQSGPFLTPYEESDDPAGTNMVNVVGFTRPDRVPGQPIYAHGTQDGNPLYLNANAFVSPGNDIGRFGNSSVGCVVGPGTVALSSSLVKRRHAARGLDAPVRHLCRATY